MGVMDLHKTPGKSSRKGGDYDKSSSSSEITKCCTNCKTTKTPLWRAGPSGPKTLCNACGIRYRKKDTESLENNIRTPYEKRRGSSLTTNSSNGKSRNSSGSNGNSLKMRVIVVGSGMLFQRCNIVKKQRCQRRRKLSLEEEVQQAAFSLMALSCGTVFA